MVKRYGKPWDKIENFVAYIADADNLKRMKKLADENKGYEIVHDLNDKKIELGLKGIGPVYLITLLYFISGGKYPIYDQFAHFSLMGIEEGTSFNGKKFTEKDLRTGVSTETDLETFFKSYQENYIKRLKTFHGRVPWNLPRKSSADTCSHASAEFKGEDKYLSYLSCVIIGGGSNDKSIR